MFFIIDGVGDFIYDAQGDQWQFMHTNTHEIPLMGIIVFWHGVSEPKIQYLKHWLVYINKSKYFEKIEYDNYR